jgi:ribosome maturation factor RimP
MGYEVVEIEYRLENGRWILRIFIDAPAGITLDDCADVSQAVSVLLDESDFIAEKYYLEVSSPGIARPLRKVEDFERFAGEPVVLRAAAPVHGRRRFKGVLLGLREGLIEVECGGERHTVHLENLDRAHLDR